MPWLLHDQVFATGRTHLICWRQGMEYCKITNQLTIAWPCYVC